MSSGIFENLEFADDVIPEDIPVDDAPMPQGEPKQTETDEYVCEVCGKALSYSGRGRPPKRCSEHKRKSSGTSVSKKGNNDAREAAEVLSQINGLIGIGLVLAPEPFKFPETASKLDDVGDRFKEEAYNALVASPALAKSIARAGGVSGGAGLVIAYGMLVASLAPVAQKEWAEKQARRREDN